MQKKTREATSANFLKWPFFYFSQLMYIDSQVGPRSLFLQVEIHSFTFNQVLFSSEYEYVL